MRTLFFVFGWIFFYSLTTAQSWTLDWHKMVGTDGADYVVGIQYWKEDLILVYGTSEFTNWDGLTSRGFSDIFILCLDTLGNQRWVKQIGGSGRDDIIQLTVTPKGSFVIHADTYSTDFDFDKKNNSNRDYFMEYDEAANLKIGIGLENPMVYHYLADSSSARIVTERYYTFNGVDSIEGSVFQFYQYDFVTSQIQLIDTLDIPGSFNVRSIVYSDSGIVLCGEELEWELGSNDLRISLKLIELGTDYQIIRESKYFLGYSGYTKLINVTTYNGQYYAAVNLGNGEIVNTIFDSSAGSVPAILEFNKDLQLTNYRYYLGKLNRYSTSIALKNGPKGIFHYYLYYPEQFTSNVDRVTTILEYLDADLQVQWKNVVRNGYYRFNHDYQTVPGFQLCYTPHNTIYRTASFQYDGGAIGDMPEPLYADFYGDVYIRKDRPVTVDASSPVFTDTHCPTAMAADPDLEQHLKAGHYPGYDRLQWWDVTGKLLPAEQSGSGPGLRIGWVSGSAGNCVLKVVQGMD